jgi:uncharacterized protein (DUF2237 family)
MRFLLLCILIIALTEGNAMAKDEPKNVLGKPLQASAPDTGFYRDGYCRTGPDDTGSHVVSATVTKEFLDYTKSKGNDLQTPRPEYKFSGLKPGDRWCLCAARWKEAEKDGVAPPVDLEATHEKALQTIPLEILKKYQRN